MAQQANNIIEVRSSPIHGLGVFALRDIAKGEVIERAPYIVVTGDDLPIKSLLRRYVFADVEPDRYLMVLGYGSLYNNDTFNPNAVVHYDDDRFVCYTAVRDISKGGEVLLSYARVAG